MISVPRIYVACLAAYNAGKHHGAWIDACQDAHRIQNDIDKMLDSSPEPDAEEFAIHDSEGLGSISGTESLEMISALAGLVIEYDEAALAAIDYFNGLEETQKMFNENYCGSYGSLGEYAAERTENEYTIPEFLDEYIDWEQMGAHMKSDQEIIALPNGHGGYFVFNVLD